MKDTVASYIAGFFDGDGSVRIQLQPRKSSKSGFRVRAIISFAQKTNHDEYLSWIKRKLKIGYIYLRNDGITELRIEGHEKVEKILKILSPFVLFKKKQVKLVLKIMDIIKKDPKALLKVARISDKISKLNYVTTKKRYTEDTIREFIKNTPVTTELS